MNNLKTFKQFLNEGNLQTPFSKSRLKGNYKDDHGAVWSIVEVLPLVDAIEKCNKLEPHSEKDASDWDDQNELTAVVKCISCKAGDDMAGKGYYTIFVESQFNEKTDMFTRSN